LSSKDQEQLVLTQLDKDTTSRLGVRSVMANIAFQNKIHLSWLALPFPDFTSFLTWLIFFNRDFVSQVMHQYNADGFQHRQPCSKKILRFPKCPIGPNERWAADGHDKLIKIGFPIYAFVDDATGKILDVYVVPDNRNVNIVAYLYLDVVERQGGMAFRINLPISANPSI
jgi:hypothetical protein